MKSYTGEQNIVCMDNRNEAIKNGIAWLELFSSYKYIGNAIRWLYNSYSNSMWKDIQKNIKVILSNKSQAYIEFLETSNFSILQSNKMMHPKIQY